MIIAKVRRISFVDLIFSIPKTIYFNFKILPLSKALKFPFIISRHIKLHGINKKTFIVNFDDLHFASSRIGFEYTVGSFKELKKGLIAAENGAIVLNGNVGLSQGIVLSAKNSKITLGKNFRCNYSSMISSCDDDINIGDDVVLGWNVTIKSEDGHYLIEKGQIKPKSLPVTIGNHVWICSNSSILKGSRIGNDCVIAYGSVVSNRTFSANLLIGGIPAIQRKDSISWQE